MAGEATEAPTRKTARADQEHRKFEWYTPQKRRPSLYEDVTIDSQPSTERHWTGPWPTYFQDGRGTWWLESTRLRVVDWYAFRDPGARWERNYYQQGAAAEAAIESALAAAKTDGHYDRFSAAWVQLLRDDLQPLAFVDYGLWLAIAGVQRECLCDTLAHAYGIEAGVKQRQFQSLVLYGMDLEERFGGFEVGNAKARFLEHAPYQALRGVVERLDATADWVERMVGAMCLDTIVGVAVRRELFMQGAAANGDIVTPAVIAPAQSEYLQARQLVAEMARFCIADEEHGPANQAVIQDWVADWGEAAKEALAAMEPVFAAAPHGRTHTEVTEAVLAEYDAICVELGVAKVKETT